MNTRSQLILLNEMFVKNSESSNNAFTRDIIRIEVSHVIDFVNGRSKIVFDFKHKSLAFNIDDKVYLRLHREYFLLEKNNLKLINQRFESYVIKRKVDNVAYELKLSINVRVHSVIFIAQLESIENELNLFNRSRSANSGFVETEDDIFTKKSYEVERILKKRERKYDKTTVTQYLIK